MIRDFNPHHPDGVSAKTPSVLALGYALTGNKEYVWLLRYQFEMEEHAARAAGREPRAAA